MPTAKICACSKESKIDLIFLNFDRIRVCLSNSVFKEISRLGKKKKLKDYEPCLSAFYKKTVTGLKLSPQWLKWLQRKEPRELRLTYVAMGNPFKRNPSRILPAGVPGRDIEKKDQFRFPEASSVNLTLENCVRDVKADQLPVPTTSHSSNICWKLSSVPTFCPIFCFDKYLKFPKELTEKLMPLLYTSKLI